VVIAILVEGFADVNLGDSEVLTMFLVTVALGYVAAEPLPFSARPADRELAPAA
jgi:hypothetical protein